MFQLRVLRSASDPSAMRLTADLAAVAAWEVAGTASLAAIPTGDTNAALKALLQVRRYSGCHPVSAASTCMSKMSWFLCGLFDISHCVSFQNDRYTG